MKDDQPSQTASWIAICRSCGEFLPQEARLAEDPYGALLADPRAARWLRRARRVPRLTRTVVRLVRPARAWILYLQVRTRLIDDVIRAFLSAGGQQIVLLGAGYDCRAARFAPLLRQSVLIEVDHPATQARKRAALSGAALDVPTRYLGWDFEKRPMAELPAALAALGLDRGRPTLTIWEGVTMYLTESAIEATVAAIRALGGPGSQLAFTYFDRRLIGSRRGPVATLSTFVARAGEPFRFGWDPEALPRWLTERGLDLLWDVQAGDRAPELLPPGHAALVPRDGRHIALAAVRARSP
jgi:methyltransferase (TIGR00027 family)